MTDSRLRELERRYNQTGAKSDEQAYDAERVRLGVAVETGFIVRTRDSAGAYRDKAQVYSESVKRSISFRRLIGAGFVVRDIEYADGAFQLLAFRQTGADVAWKILGVDNVGSVSQKFGSNSSSGDAPYALLNYEGVLGRIHADVLNSILFAGDTLGFLRDQTIFGYAGAQVFVAMQSGSFIRGNPQVVALRDGSGRRVVADGSQRVHAVFVEGSAVTCQTVEPKGVFFEGTRLAEGRYFANDELSLLRGYQGRALTLTKTLLEVPKKCLEGLLSAL